jgi:FHA domain-containing protein
MQSHARLPETLAELFDAHSGRNGMGVPRLNASELDKLRALFQGELPFAVGDVEKGVRDAYHAALDVNLMEIFLKAWAKIPAIAAMADANKYPPAERHLVPLGEHHVTSRHEPRVEVLIDEIPAFSVPLDVSLEFDFEGAVLNVAAGHIDAIKSACCRASGSVTCRNVVIASVNTGNMALKDELKLKPPFPLRAAAQQAGLTLSGFDEAGRPLTFRFLPKAGVKEATWLIGRREDRADFVIPNKTVSAEHARIRFSSGKGMEICDLDSSNGTRVDGKLVDRSYSSLADAQKIVFGFCEMQVSRD